MAQQRRRRPRPRRDLDAAWKFVLRELLPEFVAFIQPEMYAAIDWSRTPEFLDKELQAVARRAATGRRHVDLLAKVWHRDGTEEWLLIHVEVQARHEAQFDERMYLYHTLLFLRYRRPIVSLAVLTDTRADWRAGEYAYDHWGCAVRFRYPVLRVLDLRGREAELTQSSNPFAQVALAQLVALTSGSRRDPLIATRFAVIRHLIRAGLDEAKVIAMLAFLDVVLDLPEDIVARIDAEIVAEIATREDATMVRPMTSWERRGLAQGLAQGREQGARLGQQELLEQLLTRRWGPLSDARREQLGALTSEQLVALGLALFDFRDRDDLDRWFAANA